MFRIFNRYYSIQHTFYFAFENILILSFVLWGTFIGGEWPSLLLAPVICQMCLYYRDLYPPFSRFSIKEFWLKHLQAILWAVGILIVCYLVIPPPVTLPESSWLRITIFPFILIGLRLSYQAAITSRRLDTPILIMGTGTMANLLKTFLSHEQNTGYKVFHFQWDLGASNKVDHQIKRLTTFVHQQGIRQVVIALSDRRGQLPIQSLLSLRVQGVEIVEAVSFYERLSGKLCVEWLKPSTLIFSEGFNRLNLTRLSKRLSDIVLAAVGLLLASPIFLILPVLIKLTSSGPVFYRQERVGETGKPFTLIKFRSMREDAEKLTGPVWATEHDPRVTPLGKIIRALRLDEVPQMINVLKGEMSFVGPRPERALFVEKLRKKIPYYDLRFTVKPGLTGWAAVKYRYGASEDDALKKLEYDLYYIKHLSPLFDLSIVFETVRVVLMGKGAR